MMVAHQPHFLLFCDTHLPTGGTRESQQPATVGRWHFVLERLDGPERLEAADCEASANRERLSLLSVVRGLEALEQPSHVTLVTTSRYVSRGLRYGLSTWREADYKWERFGERRPIRNCDLWRRVDQALHYHGVQCRLIQAEGSMPEPASSRWSQEPAVARLPERQLAAAAVADTVATLADGAVPPVNGWSEGGLPGMQGVSRRNHWRPLERFSPRPLDTWWALAAPWIRWWRSRWQTRPACYGA